MADASITGNVALENLVCFVANVCGLDAVNAAMRSVAGAAASEIQSLTQVFSRFLPSISLLDRETFRHSLTELARIDERDLAAEAGLYLTSQQLRNLANFKFEIGNHTHTHANCRTLSTADFAGEIDRNKTVLETISGTTVRSFSVPYGSSNDLTSELGEHLRCSEYQAVFLAEGRANSSQTHGAPLDRVSIKASTDAGFFSEIEILPRLRTIRDGLFRATNAQRFPKTSSPEKGNAATLPLPLQSARISHRKDN